MAIISSLNNHDKSVQKAKQKHRILNSPVLYFYPVFIFSVNDYITLIAFQLSVNLFWHIPWLIESVIKDSFINKESVFQ